MTTATRKTATAAVKKPAKAKPTAGKSTVMMSAAKKPAAKTSKANKPAAKTSAVKTSVANKRATAAPRTLEEFMAQALAMEHEAAARYSEFADAMEMHNNREVAELFRKMATIEGKHAAQIMAAMGWSLAPALAPSPAWEGFEAAETIAVDDVHYLMHPWHALQLALAAEERAERFFAHLASVATTPSVRKAALELHGEEREHVTLIKAWLKKVPKPARDWAVDPDPPRYDE